MVADFAEKAATNLALFGSIEVRPHWDIDRDQIVSAGTWILVHPLTHAHLKAIAASGDPARPDLDVWFEEMQRVIVSRARILGSGLAARVEVQTEIVADDFETWAARLYLAAAVAR